MAPTLPNRGLPGAGSGDNPRAAVPAEALPATVAVGSMDAMTPRNSARRAPDGRAPARRLARRVAVAVAGALLVAVGVAMLVLPGPGLLAMFAGLALLATEFRAARRAQRRLRVKVRRTYGRLRGGGRPGRPPSEGAGPTTPTGPTAL